MAGTLSVEEKIKLIQILKKHPSLRTSEDRNTLLILSEVLKYLNLKLDQPIDQFASNLLVQLLETQISDNNSKKNALSEFLKAFTYLDKSLTPSLSDEELKFIDSIIQKLDLVVDPTSNYPIMDTIESTTVNEKTEYPYDKLYDISNLIERADLLLLNQDCLIQAQQLLDKVPELVNEIKVREDAALEKRLLKLGNEILEELASERLNKKLKERKAFEKLLKKLPNLEEYDLLASLFSEFITFEQNIIKLAKSDSVYKSLRYRLLITPLTKEEKEKLLSTALDLESKVISYFFDCRQINKEAFIEVCSKLKLEFQEAVDINFLKTLVLDFPLVKGKYHRRVKEQCGTLRILDVTRPVDLDDIYVDVNILDEPITYKWLNLTDLPPIYDSEFERFNRFGLGNIRQARVPGLLALEANSKIMLLGKPGSGKSTFLQNVAIRCINDEFQTNRIPIFISLRAFSERTNSRKNYSLFNYIEEEFKKSNITDKLLIERILKYGITLILMDGLDEVPQENSNHVVVNIKNFVDTYSGNQFVITCRIAAQRYRFQNFVDIEVADFDQPQIENFARKWFIAIDKISEEQSLKKAIQFIKALEKPENQQIREIAVTPILLTLTCLVFQAKTSFPSNRTKLYEEGLDILLNKWDEFRGIKRDEIYRDLTVDKKKDLLAQVALATFEQGNYFIEKSRIRQLISEYLRINNNSYNVDIEAILRAIEAQHGLLVERAYNIYSFSHLTFQEHFAARAIATTKEPSVLKKILGYITEPRWREVFLLAAGFSESFYNFISLMKEEVDSLLLSQNDQQLKYFLSWINRKSVLLESSYQLPAVRDYYFTYPLGWEAELINILDPKIGNKIKAALSRNLYADYASGISHSRNIAIVMVRDLEKAGGSTFQLVKELALELTITESLALQGNSKVQKALSDLKNQVPSPFIEIEKFDIWQKKSQEAWTIQLRKLMNEYFDIGYEWKFTKEQTEKLRQFYNANKLFLQCLEASDMPNSEIKKSIFLLDAS